METPARRSRAMFGAVLAIAALGAAVGVGLTRSDSSTTELAAAAGTIAAVQTDEQPPVDELTGAGECLIQGYEPTAAELDLANAEAAGLAEALAASGVAHTLMADAQGFEHVEYDYLSAVARTVADSYYETRFPPEPLTESEVESMRRENDALLAALEGAGLDAELIIGGGGYEWVLWDFENPDAQAAVDATYEALYNSQESDNTDPEVVVSIKAENDALAEFLDEAGIAYTRSTDEGGYGWVEWDIGDREAEDAVNDFDEQMNPPEPLGDEEREILKVENDALAAAFDDAGVEYARTASTWGYESIEWDYDDPAADKAANDFYEERYGDDDCIEEFGEWVPSEEEVAANNSETDAMASYFDQVGTSYEIVTDEYGFGILDWDYEDEAAEATAFEYWDAQEAEFVSRAAAELGPLKAAFDAAGISYRNGCLGQCETIIFDTDDPAALAVVAGLS